MYATLLAGGVDCLSRIELDQKDGFRAIMNELAQRYLVPDIIPATVRFVFLLESPHVQELKYGAPVSGSSGASMTKHLFGEAYGALAIGRLLLAHQNGEIPDPELDHVGLMNTCNIPLQSAAYEAADREEYSSFFEILEGIRSSNDRDHYSDQRWNVVQEIIVTSLRRKLQRLQDSELVMVPCGRFAQKFFRLADVEGFQWIVIRGVPHPSYNGFSQPRYQDVVERMKSQFRNLVLGG